MMLSWADRALTIVATATLTSAAWIVGGASFIGQARQLSGVDATPAAPVAPPTSEPSADVEQAAPFASVSGDLLIPVVGVRPGDLSDTFDDRRGGSRLHEALDIMADEGTLVVAAAPGKVEKLFQSEAGGNTIYIRSNDRRTIYYYAHLKDYARGLAEGQTVRRGAPLGTVGHTGNASAEGPHLHFAIMRTRPEAKWWEPATALDPYPMLTAAKTP